MSKIAETPERVDEQAPVLDATSSKPSTIRWQVLVLMSLVWLISYIDRGNISVAAPEIAREFHLSKTAMGVVLASFTWAYALGQLPFGSLGDRFGARKVLTVLMCGVSVAPFLNAFAVGFRSLVGARLFLGATESGAFPVASRGMQIWFPKSSRGMVQGVVHVFSRFAVAITPPIAVFLMLTFGWRAIFYACGSFGILWAIAFRWIYQNTPEEHKGVNQAELGIIRGLNPDGSVKKLVGAAKPKIPWRRILHSATVWYIALGWSCYFFGTNFYLTWYPTYLREYRHVSLKSLGLIGALPLIGGMLGDIVGGILTDEILKKTGNIKFARRAVAVPGFLGAGLFLIPAAMTQNPMICVLSLAASFFCLELLVGPAWAMAMDVGGEFTGTVSGIMNTVGAGAASLTPIIYGTLFDRGYWIAPFFVTAAVMLLGALTWIFLLDPDAPTFVSSPEHG